MAEAAYRSPYTGSPGSSTPGPEMTPRLGVRELWEYFWLALANTAIITVVGLVTWWMATR